MHPLLARRRLALYLGAWCAVGALLAVLYTGPVGFTAALVIVAPLCLVYAFVCLSAWYVCRAAPLHAAGAARVLLIQLGAGVVAAGLWLAAWELWMQALAGQPAFAPGVARYRAAMPSIFAAGVLLYWLAGMLHYLLIAFARSREAEVRGLELELLAREAELRALRTQIDPHFLFNSLHSISALTAADPAGARRMCLLLGDFFRSSVRLGARDEITLEEEMAMVRQYLDIEKVRLGRRLSTEIAVDAACAACRMPPLILQPLVENAVTHGIHSLIEGGAVRVTAACAAGRLDLSVENPVDDGAPARAGAGVGLTNVRQRLRMRFGVAADLRVTRAEGRFRVRLHLPCAAESEGPRE